MQNPKNSLRRATVGESLSIDIADFARRGWWRPDANIQGSSHWSIRGVETGSIGWITSPDMLFLHYTTTDSRDLKTNHTERIDVLRQVDGLGRPRVWLACPGCGARVRSLYFPKGRGASRFLCRRCHGLAYASQHEHKSGIWAAMDQVLRRESQ